MSSFSSIDPWSLAGGDMSSHRDLPGQDDATKAGRMTYILPSPDTPLKIGTRASPLALAQAHETRDRLAAAFALDPAAFEIVPIKTTGDDRALIAADRPLKEIGGKGLFTKEIEEQLLSGGIDIAVHSMKDMPVLQPAGLVLDCYLPREDVRDAFVSNAFTGIFELPHASTVGTSSLRRRAQLLHRRPDLTVVEFRGNVQTRLRKLSDGVADATFLAMAGLNRLAMADVPRTAIAPEDMLPAIAQGAIGIERRADDARTAHMLAAIHDALTGKQLAAERAFLATLDGSCETPIGGLAELDGGTLRLRGEILRPDGSDAVSDDASAPVEDGAALGHEMARKLLAQGGPGFFDWRD
ncbi:hydroxymethylbilane synthase [Primorskyibacter flagellatus]|uniref:Porphobilinogen deaminase n=2 Tax=Primorskyibacter flagellatus TaxID=1387277 RepID=A0A1W2C6M1_9RHOB|nr:hydroxymethylbilane synthase [Primorskyibacter flagellatus]